MEKKASVTNFSEINSPQDLIAYLSDSANRLENTKTRPLNMYIIIRSYPMSYQ